MNQNIRALTALTNKRTCGFQGLQRLEVVTCRECNLFDIRNSLGKIDPVLLPNVLICFDQPTKTAFLNPIV